MEQHQFSQIQFNSESSFGRKSDQNILRLILILITVLVMGIFGILAARIWDPVWNPFRPKPSKVLEKMFLKMKEIKALESETDISLEIVNEEIVNIEFKRTQKEDKREPENPKTEGSFEISFSAREKTIPKASSFLGGKILISGEFKSLNKKSFLKLTTIPDIRQLVPTIPDTPSILPILDSIALSVLSIKDKWIIVDENAPIEFLDALLVPLSKVAPEENILEEIEHYKFQFKERIEEERRIQKEIEKEFKEKLEREIENAFLKDKLFLVKKQFPNEKLDNVITYHYLIVINNEGLLNLLVRIFKIVEETMSKQLGSSFTLNEEEFKSEFKKVINELGEIEVHLWIDKKDYYLHKISLEKTLNFPKTSQESNEKGNFSLKLTQKLHNFNSQFNIEEPKDVKSLKEILIPIFEKLLESLTSSQFMGSPLSLPEVQRIPSE